MTDFSGLVGKHFLATQISRGSVAGTGHGTYQFTEANSLADQSAIIGNYGTDATVTFTGVSVDGGFIDFSATIVSANSFASGTITGNFLGNDATDFLLNAKNVPGVGSAFLYFTNTVAQQPGTVAPGNIAIVGDVLNNTPYTPPACFAEGTRVATTRGPVAVEELMIGDQVVIHARDRGVVAGVTRPIIWLGHRSVACARHPRPWDVLPVRVHAGAFADGVPQQDVVLSPDHAIYADGVLVPVRYLVNDANITRDAAEEVTYWHVELDAHDIILAEGLPAESYLDSGNRGAFANAQVPDLLPGFAVRDQLAWTEHACGALIESGPILDTIRARLAQRAGSLMPPAVSVTIASVGLLHATLPPGTTRVCLTSTCARPADERRRLGAAIAGIALDGAPLALDAPALAAGFHQIEANWRWTNGEGVLLLEPDDAVRELTINVAILAAA